MQLVGVFAQVAAWLAAVLAENLGRERDANARSEPPHVPLPDNWISTYKCPSLQNYMHLN